MKKELYIILLIVEFLIGFCLLTLVTSALGWIYFGSVAAVWAVLTVLLLVKLKNAADESGKRKVRIGIAVVMLIPAVAAGIGLAGFVWAMTATGW